MAVMYCELCERPIEARRRVGGWTHFFGILTLGLGYLAVPLYRKRCPICMGAAVSRIAPGDRPQSPPRLPASELEARLARAQDELDAAMAELERVRAERDFYEDLRGKRTKGRQE